MHESDTHFQAAVCLFIPFLLRKHLFSLLSLFAVDDSNINGCWWDRWFLFSFTLISSYISLFLSSSVLTVFSLLFSFTRRKTRFLRPLNIDQENKKTGKLERQLYQEKKDVWEKLVSLPVSVNLLPLFFPRFQVRRFFRRLMFTQIFGNERQRNLEEGRKSLDELHTS